MKSEKKLVGMEHPPLLKLIAAAVGLGPEKAAHTFPTGSSFQQDQSIPKIQLSLQAEDGITCSWQGLFPGKPWEPG